MKKIILFQLFFITLISYSQEVNISTKFVQIGSLYENLSFSISARLTQFKKGQKCIVVEYLGRNNYKIRFKKWVGFVKSEDLYINTEMIDLVRVHEEIERIKREENNKKSEENIKKRIEERNQRIIIEDSLNKIKEEERNQRIIIEDSLNKIKEEEKRENERLELIEYRNNCHYAQNEIDEFDNIKIIRTTRYWISSSLNLELFKKGKSNYIFFNLLNDLGCASSYSHDRSFVKVKLENDDIVIFYHSWDIDCGSFSLKGKLTNSDIVRLKKSPIKSIRLQGTDYYHDVKNLKYKEFFIDKLKCIK